MIAELFNAPPESGSIPERQFDAHGNCTWVRFEPSGSEPWAGVFGNGCRGEHVRTVVLFDNELFAFVIAGGQGYVVDVETGELRHKTETDFYTNAIRVPQRDFIVATDDLSLAAIGIAGVLHKTGRIAFDVVSFTGADEHGVDARIFIGSGHASFRLSFDGWQSKRLP